MRNYFYGINKPDWGREAVIDFTSLVEELENTMLVGKHSQSTLREALRATQAKGPGPICKCPNEDAPRPYSLQLTHFESK